MVWLVKFILATSPLLNYVEAPDPAYSWQHVTTERSERVMLHELSLTSGSWQGKPWEHRLLLIVPQEVKHETVILQIMGGRNDEESPAPHADLVALAERHGCVVAELHQVPNQPLTFDEPRIEDALIAYGWDRYLKTGDPVWLPQLPMARSVVRAMDAMEKYLGKSSSFVLTGRSKRGWTAWTAAEADPRVKGVVPCVIDLLNLKESFAHHHRVYGDWSPALHDYVKMGIPDHRETPEFHALVETLDPHGRECRLDEVPKYLVNSTGDPFFLPDSSQFYYKDLEGPKALRYVPNSGHDLTPEVADSLSAFYGRLLSGEALPRVDWSYAGHKLEVTSNEKPTMVRLWQATNPEARDFRLYVTGPIWSSTPSDLSATFEPPEKGFRAYLMELTFADGFVCTTDVFILTPGTQQCAPAVPLGALQREEAECGLTDESPQTPL